MIDVTPGGISNDSSDEHFLKAELPISVIEEGSDICVSDVHSLKADFPINFMFEGTSICISLLQ